MKISADQTGWRWLIVVELPFVTFPVAIASFAGGYALFGVGCSFWTVGVLWSVIVGNSCEVYLEETGVQVIRMPEHYGALSPILHVVPLQLLAYHTACARGTDVDKPRNLAKSVTVE
jgi:hypothetical protein